MPLTAKQIRYFGTPQQKAALKRKRSGGRSKSRRPAARHHHTKRTHMAHKKKGGSRRQKASWLTTAAGTSAALEASAPMLPAAAAALQGDVAGAVSAARDGLKQTVAPANIVRAVAPIGVAAIVRKGLRALGVKAPKVFGRKLF